MAAQRCRPPSEYDETPPPEGGLDAALTAAAAEVKRLEAEGNFGLAIELASRLAAMAVGPRRTAGEEFREGRKVIERLHRRGRAIARQTIREITATRRVTRRRRGHAARPATNAPRHGSRRNSTRGSPSDDPHEADPDHDVDAATAAFPKGGGQ
jgi:hypothetical protein